MQGYSLSHYLSKAKIKKNLNAPQSIRAYVSSSLTDTMEISLWTDTEWPQGNVEGRKLHVAWSLLVNKYSKKPTRSMWLNIPGMRLEQGWVDCGPKANSRSPSVLLCCELVLILLSGGGKINRRIQFHENDMKCTLQCPQLSLIGAQTRPLCCLRHLDYNRAE